MTRPDKSELEIYRPVERKSEMTDRATQRFQTPRTSTAPIPLGAAAPPSRTNRRRSQVTKRGPDPRTGAGPGQESATAHVHRYTVQLSTTQLDHEREITQIVRAMNRKKWAVESRNAIPGASDRETVTILTFVQTTSTERVPNAPVRDSSVKSGASVPRRFS